MFPEIVRLVQYPGRVVRVVRDDPTRKVVCHYYDELCAALTRYEAEGGTLEELYADIVEIVCEMDADYDF